MWVREKMALLKAAMKKAGMESIPGADRLKGTLDSMADNEMLSNENAAYERELLALIEKQAKREKTPPSEQKRATVAKKITDRVSSARDRLAKMGFGGRLQQSQETTLLYQKPEPEALDP